MEIELHRLTIREVLEGYEDNAEEGVVAYGGKLDIRPRYQREFVYKDKQRNAVIETIRNGFPLNVMYWVKTDQGKFEVLDGQQRTISIGQFLKGDFSVQESYTDEHGKLKKRPRYFHNLNDEEQKQIWDYELMIYICEGTDKERLDWFRIINIAGMKLTEQELRNAVYTGAWLSDAKLMFSKTNCAASLLTKESGALTTGSPIRQELLETAIKWLNDGKIEDYMAKHQHDAEAKELWQYFQAVIRWVRATFTTYRKEMANIDWGGLYNQFKDRGWDADKLESDTQRLMEDEDVTSKPGIYTYLLTGDEKYLNIRKFTDKTRRETYEQQKKKCANEKCPSKSKDFELDDMEADHINPWSKGGRTIAENCQMLCKPCNRKKGGQ